MNTVVIEDALKKSLSEKNILVFEVTSQREARSVFSWVGRYKGQEDATCRKEVLQTADRILKEGNQLRVYLNGTDLTRYTEMLLGEVIAGNLKLEDMPSVRNDIPRRDPRPSRNY